MILRYRSRQHCVHLVRPTHLGNHHSRYLSTLGSSFSSLPSTSNNPRIPASMPIDIIIFLFLNESIILWPSHDPSQKHMLIRQYSQFNAQLLGISTFLSSADFFLNFKIIFKEKSAIPLESQTVLIQIRTDILSSLV